MSLQPPSCSICMDHFDEGDHCPRMLPCGHSLCHRCIGQLIQSSSPNRCPQCRGEFGISRAGDAPKNFSLLQHIQMLTAGPSPAVVQNFPHYGPPPVTNLYPRNQPHGAAPAHACYSPVSPLPDRAAGGAPTIMSRAAVRMGSRVVLSPSCSDHLMLKPGQIGTVIEDNGTDTPGPFKVEYDRRTHWYTRSELVCADGHAAQRFGAQSSPILSPEEFESFVSDESAALIAYFDDLRRAAPAYDHQLQLAVDRRDYGTAELVSAERETLRQVIAADTTSWRKALIQDALSDGIISRIRDEDDRPWRETTHLKSKIQNDIDKSNHDLQSLLSLERTAASEYSFQTARRAKAFSELVHQHQSNLLLAQAQVESLLLDMKELKSHRNPRSAELERRSRAILSRPPRNNDDFSLYDAALSIDLLRSKSLPTINAVLTALHKPTVASLDLSELVGAGFSTEVIYDWANLELSVLRQRANGYMI